jgi:hypothetical protein
MPNTTSPMDAFNEARMRAGADIHLSVLADPRCPPGANFRFIQRSTRNGRAY